MTCCAICIIPCVPCLPYVTIFFNRPLFTYVEGKLNGVFLVCAGSGHAVVCGGVLQIAFNGLQKTVGNLTLDALERLKSLLKWPMSASLSLESDNKVTAGKTLKHLTKATGSVTGIGRGYDEGMESRSVMVPANGLVHKLREELKDDGALLFGPHILGILGHWR